MFSISVVITIGGLPGSGTTTMARRLAEHYDLKHVYAGKIFREMAKERDMGIEEFSKVAENNPEIDLEIDRRQREAAEKGDVILEGRLAAFVAAGELDHVKGPDLATLKIWLKAPLEVRSERVAKREKIDVEEARRRIQEREKSELKRYKEIYGVDPTDLSLYDLVLDTSRWSEAETFSILKAAIDPLLEREDP
ncbi:(d)CMP kinase [Methanopyrus sp. SNP6]|uniref:(d)CMP kinase n=1 Tax=Methanopyrus sp. SNP6 TaxID=1937005 RepID=UPI0011E5AB1A|nr:AAA family ATPase [Methanopyrus sp. SNP6]